MNKHPLKHLWSSFWVLINPFNGFLSFLGNRKEELPSQEMISWITNGGFVIELNVQSNPLFVHLSTLDESWLCWLWRSSSILILIYFFWIKRWISKYFIPNTLSFLVTSIRKFCWNLNSLNSSLISNKLFLIQDLVKISFSLYF